MDLVDEFIAADANGRRYKVLIYQSWIDTSTLEGRSRIPGMKALRLADGSPVNPTDDPERFEIVATGTTIKRL